MSHLDRTPSHTPQHRRWQRVGPLLVTLGSIPWLIQPGYLQPDTKVDLIVSPGRYLLRSLDAWSAHSGLGELQNQAYGYLFPMGSFFWLGDVLGLPAWAIQRSWWMLMLLVAGAGTYLVLRRIWRVSALAASVGAFAFALSPRVLTLLSNLSVEAWPGCLLPWVLWVVWRHTRRDAPDERTSTWRFVAEIGVIAICLGGVNATASLVTLLAGALALITRTRRPLSLAAYGLGCLLGASWWLGPLLVLGGYAYPFLDYIETSRITTAVTSLPGVLRGASDWVAYILDAEGHPVWQSGWVIAQSVTSILAGCALAALGLVGLRLRPHPQRSGETAQPTDGHHPTSEESGWNNVLWVWLLTGVAAMTVGYHGSLSGPLASHVRTLLDGPAAFLRNIHKFDVLVRFPLVVGLTTCFEWARRSPLASPGPGAWRRRVRVAGIVTVLVLTWTPLWQGRTGSAGAFQQFPAATAQTAQALDAAAQSDGGATLVWPFSRTASYRWGTITDEPLTAFAHSAVVTRASAPLVHPGPQRLLDASEQAVLTGHPDDVRTSLAALRRAGISRIVIADGLTSATQTAPASRYRNALERAGVTSEHRTFGRGAHRYDLYVLRGETAPARNTPMQAVHVTGGPESTLSLLGAGVNPQTAFLTQPPHTTSAARWLTDDVRRRVYANGKPVTLAYGPTLPDTTPTPSRIGVRDLTFPGYATAQTVMAIDGVDELTATHSLADPFDDAYRGPGAAPTSAVDDSAQTAWLTSARTPGALTLTWRTPRPVALHWRATTVGRDAPAPALRVHADGKPLPVDRAGSFTIPAGTRTVRLNPTATPQARDSAAVGISSITGSSAPRAITQLPGTLKPQRDGAVLTQTTPQGPSGPLVSQDAGDWTRRVRLAGAGKLTLTVTSGAHNPSGHPPALAVRTSGGSWQRVPVRGDHATVNARGAFLDIQAISDVRRIRLTPTSATAQRHLGLGTPLTPDVRATTTGENQGWRASHGASVVVDGWRQAATSTTPVTWTFTPQRLHTTALTVGAIAAGAVMVLLVLTHQPRRRERTTGLPQPAPTSGRTRQSRSHRRMCAFATTVVVFLAAGPWTLPASLLGYLIGRRARPATALWTTFGALTLVGPALCGFGAVDSRAMGVACGQLLSSFALVIVSAVGAPTRWTDVPPPTTSTGPRGGRR